MFIASLTILLAGALVVGFLPAMECFECAGAGQLTPMACFARPDEIKPFPCYLCQGRGKMTIWSHFRLEARRLKYKWDHRHQALIE